MCRSIICWFFLVFSSLFLVRYFVHVWITFRSILWGIHFSSKKMFRFTRVSKQLNVVARSFSASHEPPKKLFGHTGRYAMATYTAASKVRFSWCLITKKLQLIFLVIVRLVLWKRLRLSCSLSLVWWRRMPIWRPSSPTLLFLEARKQTRFDSYCHSHYSYCFIFCFHWL